MSLQAFSTAGMGSQLAVVPVLVGPLQALLAILPGILIALGGSILALFRPSAIKKLFKLLWAQKVVVVLVVLGVWGLFRLYPVVFAGSREAVSQANAGGEDWPLFRGGPDRRGAVPGAGEPAHGNVVWSFSHEGTKTFYSSPAVVGNRVYATSARYEYFKDQGAICSVDAHTGALVWAFTADNYRSTFSSPAVSGRYLVVGEGLHLTDDARIFCFDLEESERRREGVKLWEYRTDSHVESSPCIADGRIYIGAGDDGMYCFELEPDADGNPQMVWHLSGEDYPDCETSPVVVDGKVYFGLGIGGQAVVCADAATGEELWRVDAPYPVFSAPSISNGRLFVGMGHGDFVNTAEQAAANRRARLEAEGASEAEIEAAVGDIRPVGEVWCIDIASQSVSWKYPLPRTVLGCVATVEDRIYFGSRDGNLYCLTTDGDLVRKWNAHAPIITSPAVADEYVYCMTDNGRLTGLDRSTLEPVWDVPLNVPTFSSPSVAFGHVYVGTTGSGLLCVGEEGRIVEKPVWSGYLDGAEGSGWADGSLLPEQGTYAWGYEGDDDLPQPPTIQAPAAYLEGAFYVGISQGDVHGLARITMPDGPGSAPVRDWFVQSDLPVVVSPAATDAEVFFADGQPGDEGRMLRCVDAAQGTENWALPTDAEASGAFAITRNALYVADRPTGLSRYEWTGGAAELRWHSEIGPTVGAPAVTGDIILASTESRVVALDAGTGKPLWERRLPSAAQTGPVLLADRVWVGMEDGVAGYGIVGDVEGVSVGSDRVAAPLVSGSGVLAAVTDGGRLLLLDPTDGAVVANVDDVAAELPPLIADGALLYAAEGAVQRYDLETKSADSWARLRASWPGRMVTPMVMVDSHVFFATDKKGFVCMRPR